MIEEVQKRRVYQPIRNPGPHDDRLKVRKRVDNHLNWWIINYSTVDLREQGLAFWSLDLLLELFWGKGWERQYLRIVFDLFAHIDLFVPDDWLYSCVGMVDH